MCTHSIFLIATCCFLALSNKHCYHTRFPPVLVQPFSTKNTCRKTSGIIICVCECAPRFPENFFVRCDWERISFLLFFPQKTATLTVKRLKMPADSRFPSSSCYYYLLEAVVSQWAVRTHRPTKKREKRHGNVTEARREEVRLYMAPSSMTFQRQVRTMLGMEVLTKKRENREYILFYSRVVQINAYLRYMFKILKTAPNTLLKLISSSIPNLWKLRNFWHLWIFISELKLSTKKAY